MYLVKNIAGAALDSNDATYYLQLIYDEMGSDDDKEYFTTITQCSL